MKNVTLIVKDLTKMYGTSTPLTVTLKDGSTPLSNYPVVFTIHGVTYTRFTDGSGVARLNINLHAGTYPCTVRIIGDSTFNPISKQVLVRVITDNPTAQDTKQNSNYFEVNKIQLWVIMNDGFDVKPGQNIKETQLLHDDDNYNSPTFYFNSGYDGDEFEISIVIRETDFFNGQQVIAILNAYNKMNTVVSVVTDAMVVANGKYTMQIKDKKQTNKGYSIWKLRFKQFYENNLSFESIYGQKTSTLSSIDRLLLKQTNGINDKSPMDVVTALQKRLELLGYFDYNIYGYYASAVTPVYRFQVEYMKEPNKMGVCDYETITAIVEAVNHGYVR